MGNLSAGAFLVALSGIVIVFIMLAVLCFMIPIISKVVQSVQKKPVRERVATSEPKSVPTAAPAVTAVSGDVALIDVDEKTAACIMAIVSHETGIPLSELIFKTIKAI
ncbi:MAG: OadG family protein [Butyricicoccus pullicaecorum]|nr:OadG family protein [Butyricicoccus pullicaecorum]